MPLLPVERNSSPARHATPDRNPKLGKHFRSRSASIKRVRTKVESVAVTEVCNRAAAQITAFFEEGDSAAAAREIDRSCQAGDASADHDDVVAQSEARWYRESNSERSEESTEAFRSP